MSDPTPNNDRSQLSNEKLESLLRRPDLPPDERAGIEEELTNRYRDELLKTSQVRVAGSTARPPNVTPPPFNAGQGSSFPPTTKSNFPIVVGIIVALIIIGIIGFMGVMVLLSNQSRSSSRSKSRYGTRCETDYNYCYMNGEFPVGSSCTCPDDSGRQEYLGTIQE